MSLEFYQKLILALETISNSTSSLNSTLEDQSLKDDEIVLAIIKDYVDCLSHGFDIGNKIYKLYRITTHTNLLYEELVRTNSPFKLLEQTVNKNCKYKLEMVADFIWIFKLTKEQVCYKIA